MIEVYLDGKLVGTRRVPDSEFGFSIYQSWQQNVQRRERVVNSYIEELKERLRPLTRARMLNCGELVFVLKVESEMNRENFMKNYLKAS